MEYMILLHSDESQTPDFAPGTPEFESMMGEWMAFNQSLIDSGRFVSGASLAPTSTATVVAKSFDGASTVTDGPYAETKEQLGGFYIVEAADLDEAIEIATRVPIPVGSFEIRPVAFRPEASGGLTPCVNHAVDAALRHLAREDAGRVVALLARRFGDLDLADDAVQDALIEATQHWAQRGVPQRPAAWLHQVARRKAIDRLRRADVHRRRLTARAGELLDADEVTVGGAADLISDDGIDLADERLRLLLLCCHPALELDAQVALTLRLVSGLTTEEIASALLVPTPTLAQRITRAKRKIRDANIVMSLPDSLDERLSAVLSIIYLTFNEGYLTGRRRTSALGPICVTRRFGWLASWWTSCPGQPSRRGCLRCSCSPTLAGKPDS